MAADSENESALGERFEIEGRPLGLVLTDDGLRHPLTPRGGGFGYTPGNKVTGAMTAAGITILALCQGQLKGPIAKRTEDAITRESRKKQAAV